MRGARIRGSGFSKDVRKVRSEPRTLNPESCCITLLTDFGFRDGYVAAMKGVLLTEAPGARIVDAGHDIPAQDVRAAAWTLGQYHAFFPKGTIHVAVVDPGVGTGRNGLMARIDGRYYLAPDNGLLTWVLSVARKVDVRILKTDSHRKGPVSATFHGRDIFAWAAGRLAKNARSFSVLGRPAGNWVRLEGMEVIRTPKGIRGRVMHIDRFGNLITNITRRDWASVGGTTTSIHAGMGAPIRLVRTYEDARTGSLVALFGSSDTLEVAVVGGNAAKKTGLKRDSIVTITEPSPRNRKTLEKNQPSGSLSLGQGEGWGEGTQR